MLSGGRLGNHFDGMGAFGALLQHELDLLPFAKQLKAGHLNGRIMDKHVFARLKLNKPVAFSIIEPFDCT